MESIGKLWKPEARFLSASLEQPWRPAKMAWPELYQRNSEMALNVLRTGSTGPLADAGTLLNDLITQQVDRTQDAFTTLPSGKSIHWERHTDAGACPWCSDQRGEFEATGRWLRHGNCKCFKVRG